MTKENKIKIIKYIWYIVGTVSLLMAPVVSYFMFEYVTGNLDTVPYYMAVLNIGWIYVLYLALFAVTGRTRIAVPAASCVLYVISLAETFVVAFRSRPIMLWDVMAFRTAMTVSGNYEFFITRQMKTAFVLLLLMNVFLWFTPRRVRGWKLRLAVGGGIAASIAGYGAWFFAVLVPSWGLGINMWAINGTYQEYGYVLSTAVSLQYVVKKPPQGYSNARLKEIYNRLEESIYAEAGNGQAYPVKSQAYPESPENPENPENRPEEGQPVTPVNLICIMNESLAELKTAGDFTTNTEYFPFMDSLEENTVRGSLCVPVFGSMTSNTEFEFLTGDSMALLPANSIAYQFNVKPDTYSMVSTLKDQGYYSVAMHPYPGENWNRVECYQNMGFDAFLDQEFTRAARNFATM